MLRSRGGVFSFVGEPVRCSNASPTGLLLSESCEAGRNLGVDMVMSLIESRLGCPEDLCGSGVFAGELLVGEIDLARSVLLLPVSIRSSCCSRVAF